MYRVPVCPFPTRPHEAAYGWGTHALGVGLDPERRYGWATRQAMKLGVTKKRTERPFWQKRYYDFNVRTEEKVLEKRRYIHRNPVGEGIGEFFGGVEVVELSAVVGG